MRYLILVLLGLLLSAPASAVNVTVELIPGWNPVAFQGTNAATINANGAAGMAIYTNGGYQVVPLSTTNVNAGEGTFRGFFIFATEPGSLNYVADENTKVLAIELRSGWNLVGFPTPNNIPGANLSVFENGTMVPLSNVLLPLFYRLLPGSTTAVDVTGAGQQLLPGRPYWVFALRPCQLRFVPFIPTP